MNRWLRIGGLLCITLYGVVSAQSLMKAQFERQLAVVQQQMVRHNNDEAAVVDNLEGLLSALEAAEGMYQEHAALHGIIPRIELVTSQSNDQLHQLVAQCAARLNMPAPHILFVHDHLFVTAGAAGTDPDAAVLLVGSGLVEQLKAAELEAVVLHELAHVAHDHIPQHILITLLLTLFLNLLLLGAIIMWARRVGYLVWQWRSIRNFVAACFLIQATAFVPVVNERLVRWYEYGCEYQADAVAAANSSQLDAMSSALTRLESILSQHKQTQSKVYDHVRERIEDMFGQWSQLHDSLVASVTECQQRNRAYSKEQHRSHPTFAQRQARLNAR